VMVIINAYYYYQFHGIGFNFAFGIFLSLIVPASVYFYSEEVGDDTEISDNEMQITMVRMKLKETEIRLKKALEDAVEWKGEYMAKEAELFKIKTEGSPEDKSLIGLNR